MSKRHVILNAAIMKNFTYTTKLTLTYELNLRDKMINSKSIRLIGSIEEYYPIELEEILMNVENKVSTVLNKIIYNNLIDRQNIKIFHKYILLMMLRNPTLSKKILFSSAIPIMINKDHPTWHHQLVSISLKYIDEIIESFSHPIIII